jgi:hypothetical protein
VCGLLAYPRHNVAGTDGTCLAGRFRSRHRPRHGAAPRHADHRHRHPQPGSSAMGSPSRRSAPACAPWCGRGLAGGTGPPAVPVVVVVAAAATAAHMARVRKAPRARVHTDACRRRAECPMRTPHQRWCGRGGCVRVLEVQGEADGPQPYQQAHEARTRCRLRHDRHVCIVPPGRPMPASLVSILA